MSLFTYLRIAARRRSSPRPQAPALQILQLEDRITPAPFQPIQHFVVIYQENWSFDGLYGSFPGANGIQNANASNITQRDKNGVVIPTTPAPLNGKTADPRFPPTNGQPALPTGPYNISQYVQPTEKTGDIVHRFYTEQLQIDNGVLKPSTGTMDGFFAWSDNPGLTMSRFDATNLPEGLLAQQYTMSDNFFHAAYGGSYLNHQFLVAAGAAPWNQPLPTSNPNFVSKISDLSKFNDGALSADGKFGVNTIFSANLPPTTFSVATDQLQLPINDTNPSMPGYDPNIGDRLSAAGISWKWYSGDWNLALASENMSDPNHAAQVAQLKDDQFQWHHQPFAYFANYAPNSANGKAHLQDEQNLLADLASGNLPAVSFVKPVGINNEHPGYAALLAGQQHVQQLIQAIQNSSSWGSTAIIITYDEHGGRWDHVKPPQANGIWGDGLRVPAIIVSPFAKRGFVDHTEHDTLSILRTIEERFNIQPLTTFDAQASDLSSAFQFSTPFFATSADAGGAPKVNIYNSTTKQLIFSFTPFDSAFTGGVRIAIGDVNGDGTPDLIVAAGRSGGPHVKVYDGVSVLAGQPQLITGPLGSFFAFDSNFTGGISVATGDFNHDGYADIVVAADAGGGPHVKVFNGKSGALMASFMAFDTSFTGGIHIATGDLNGDGYDDLAVGAGAGGGPHVKVYDGKSISAGTPTLLSGPLGSFFAYDASFTGGVYLAIDYLNASGHAQLITGAGAGGSAHVKVYDGITGVLLKSFLAFDPAFSGGVRLATGRLVGTKSPALLVAAGPGGGPQAVIFDGVTLNQLDAFFTFDPAFRGGIFVSRSYS